MQENHIFVKFEGDKLTLSIEAVKEWVSRYKTIIENVEKMMNRAETLRDKISSPQSVNIDGMPHGNSYNGDRLGNLVVKCTSIEEEIQREMTKARAIYKEIDTAIKKIDGPGWPDEKVVLQMKYLDLLGWDDINDVLWLSKPDYIERYESFRRRTFKIHRSALFSLAEIIVSDITVQENNTKRSNKK